MYSVIHETNAENIINILKTNKLFRSSECQKRNLKKGQGYANRRLTKDPSISLTNLDFAQYYDEVDAVYCRLLRINAKITKLQFGDGNCILVFSEKILKDHRFILNTEENFGFQIAKNGHEGISQFSGEPGLTITSYNKLNMLANYDFDQNASEIAFLSNISLKYLKSIFVKEQYQTQNIINLCHMKGIQIYTI
ncbi:MAG: hypothetical protein ACRCZ0_10600 [Cetobacterium sp.]